MATFAKSALRPGATEGSGAGILVAAAATPGTAIHSGPTTTTSYDEIWLWASNTDTTARKLTIEFGGTTAGFLIEQTIPAESGLVLIVPGLIIKGNATAVTVAAFAATANVVNIFGYVNRIS